MSLIKTFGGTCPYIGMANFDETIFAFIIFKKTFPLCSMQENGESSSYTHTHTLSHTHTCSG